MKTKICKKCKKKKKEEEFPIGSNQSGKRWFLPICRECKKTKSHKWRRCSKCGEIKPLTPDYFYMQENKFKYYKCKECWNKKVDKVDKVDKKVDKVDKKNKGSIKDENLKIEGISLNGLNGDLKAIELYKGLSHKICLLMRRNRIEKYGINTQNIILDLMNVCCKHLQKELKEKVIIAEWE